MMNNVDDYKNTIVLLKQALLFYANENNYNGNNSPIILDKGYQARFALKLIEEFEEEHKKMEENWLNNNINSEL